MVDLVKLKGPKLDDNVENTFRVARQNALNMKATGVIIMVIHDEDQSIVYNVHAQGLKNSQVIGYMELGKSQVYERMFDV